VGGEALHGAALRGWPERARIFNEYGPTEATVGCCVYRVPAGWAGGEGPVPIGRPIAEARLHVLDGEAAAVPVGAPGELWIGGAGLARGYLGRPERTAERFLPDPYGEPGARLYRTGDRARWRPDGLLEYLGRLDEQVKVRGYRIEPGEVEAALAEHPEIERAAVVARPDPDGQKRLVAYVVGQVETEALRQHLAARLPEPLIPAAFVRLDALPLTSNGKVDRRALLSLDEPSRSPSSIEDRFVAPRDRTEELLAEVWLQVLGEPRTGGRIGVHDSFFELGGDSILSLQVVSRAAKVGLRLTPRQLFERRTIAELAPVVVPLATAPQRGPETVSGPVPLTPIQKRFFAAALPHSEHYNQSVLLAPVTKPFEPERLRLAITALWVQHDALRLRFPDPHPHPLSHPHSPRPGEGRHRPEEEKVGVSVAFPPLPGGRECGWERGPGGEGPQQICAPSDTPPGLLQIDLSALPEPLRLTASEAAAGVLQASFDLSRGPLLRAALLSTGDPRGDRLLVILHHLVVDGVSWRILVQDLEEACRQLERGERIALPPKTTSFQSWAEHLREHARSAAAVKEAEWWLEHVRPVERRLPVEAPMGGGNTVASLRSAGLALTAEETRALLEEAPRAYRTQINDLLLAALVEAFAPWTGSRRLLIDLEGHGREDLFPDVDLSRTVGWLTSVFPVALDLTGSEAPGEAIKAVKEQLRAVPGRGVGFGIVRWLGDGETAERLRRLPVPEVSFNYLGQIAAGPEEERRFRLAGEPMGDTDFRGQPRAYLLEVHGGVADGRLRMQIGYSADLHRAATVEALAERYAAALRRLIQHCLEPGAGGVTPSDFPLADLDAPALARITAAMSGPSGPIEDLYPLSPLQQGMLFHALHAPGSGDYVVQMSVGFGADLDVAAFERSWQQVVDRHAVLRTSFYWLGLDEPLQRVHARLPLVWERRDWRGLPTAEQAERVADYLRAERERGFHPGTAPLLRLALLHLDAEDGTAYRFVWTHHHAILDGWSLPILLRELFTCYAAARQGTAARLPPVRSYRDYIAWLRQQDLGVAEAFWRAELAGFRTPTPLPGAAAEAGLEEERVQSRRQTVLPGEVSDALRAFARRHQLTLNTVLQGAWALLLARSGGADDVVFGAVTAGRGAPIPGIESMVGLFVNTLPVRVRIPRRLPAAPWLGRLQERQAAARQFEHTPLARVQSWSEVPAGEALFASILSFGNYPVDEALREDAGTALTIGGVEGIEQTHYPLAVDVLPGRDLGVQILYEEPRLDGVAVERILGHFANLLTAIAADAANTAADRPAAELPMLSPVEEAQLLAAGVAAERPEETRTLVERFAQRAARTPWQAALTFGGVRLTWAELDERSSALAAYLRRQGIGPEARVGLAIEPSLERVVGLLGILKAGGAVVPVDPAAPGDWLRQVLAAAGAALCLTAERWRPVVGALVEKVLCLDRDWPLVMSGGRGVRAAGGVGLESLACVSYAAAHGRPLGLMVSQRGLFSEEAVREDFAVLLKILAGPGPHPGPSPRALPWAQSGRAFGPQDADGVYLLDRRQQWVPVGSPGEVCVGGAGLARGWLGRPELTAETFVPHPWSAEPGARLFRTGRWARRRADGTIELLGARDSCEVVE
jgi:non-ribosomal peptide synthase protein (TIGR01720 family)